MDYMLSTSESLYQREKMDFYLSTYDTKSLYHMEASSGSEGTTLDSDPVLVSVPLELVVRWFFVVVRVVFVAGFSIIMHLICAVFLEGCRL